MHNDALNYVFGDMHGSRPQSFSLRKICNQATTYQRLRWLQSIKPPLEGALVPILQLDLRAIQQAFDHNVEEVESQDLDGR